MTARGDGQALWASPDLARAYAAVRSDLSDGIRAAWSEAFRAAAPSIPPRRVLDVGCGTGRFTVLLAEVFGRPTLGIDGSPEMLRERVVAATALLAFASGDATALPLRAGAIDLALLSMVYHLLFAAQVADAAVAELYRVIAPAGRVFVRTPSLEIIDRIAWLPFFPGARAIDERRLPPRDRSVATFERAGFTTRSQRTIEQSFAESPMEAFEKVRRRAFSTLRLLSDEAFAEGLARYEANCRSSAPVTAVEALDFFVFERAAG